ncbi:MAG TPA: hypothetical protein VJ476_14055 [Rhizomicrobium sp.]|nr:hypothetical protein [Rhizomicrobium sp.]
MHGQKKRRKRSIEGTAKVGGFELGWELRSEPQWSTEHGHVGMSFVVTRTDGTFRELILEYPMRTIHRKLGDTYYERPAFFPQRPRISRKTVEADIERAIEAGWEPASRGKAFVFEVLKD